LPEHSSSKRKDLLPRKVQTLILVFVHHMMSSGCSLKEYPQNFNKGMQDLGKS